MKSAVLILLAACLLALGGWQWLPVEKPPETTRTPAAEVQKLHPGTLAVQTDGVALFKKVFWRALQAEDRILHAERREWTEDAAHGVSRWQSFLCVEAGQDLLNYLKRDNAFGAHPASQIALQSPPVWFPTNLGDFDIFTTGSLHFLFSRQDGRVYAADSGRGFAPAQTSIAPANTATSTLPPTGRLPTKLPPVPKS
jgi:hypothetical protein